MNRILLFLISLFVVHTAIAQDENPTIVTDRPDQTESAITIPHKTFQIESGFTFGWDKQDGVSTQDLGFMSNLFRYGITKRFEARVGLAFAGYDEEDENTGVTTSTSGMIPLMLGFKWNFLYGDGPIPTLAILSHVNIPALASKDYSEGNVMQNFIFSGSWVLSPTFSFGFNIGSRIDWEQSDFTTLYSSSLGMSFTDWMGGFVELYGFLPAGEYADHRFDFGLTFPVRHNLQFDVSAGMGISKNSPDGFAGFGFAWRIPN